MNETQFLALSYALTGAAVLDPGRSKRFLDRITLVFDTRTLTKLAELIAAMPSQSEARDAWIDSAVMTQKDLHAVAKAILLLWYTGDLKGTRSTEQDYFAGLVWSVVGAHPPALSGGYFGHWTYPPDA